MQGNFTAGNRSAQCLRTDISWEASLHAWKRCKLI